MPASNLVSASALEIPSIDVLLDIAKRKLDAQNSQISALDSKAGFVFGSASLITAGIAAFQKGAFDTIAALTRNGANLDWWGRLPVLSAVVVVLLFYLKIVNAAHKAYAMRDYASITLSMDMRDKYIVKAPEATKLSLLDTMIKGIEANSHVLAEKLAWTEVAVGSLIMEARIVAFLIVVQGLFLTFS